MTAPATREQITVGEAELTVATWGERGPDIILLHDGIGSIGQWRNFPSALAEAAGARVLAYDRPGHGASTPVPDGPWPADWMYTQADLFDLLLDRLELDQGGDRPLLVGHSDGGSIALLHAAAHSDRLRGVVALACHSYMESICVGSIRTMRTETDRWVSGLARFHDHPDAVFEAWSGGWVGEEFQSFDLRPALASITVPTAVVQGGADEYATDAMVYNTAAAVGADTVTTHILDGAHHAITRDATDPIIEIVIEMLQTTDTSGRTSTT